MATGVYGQQSPITWVNGNTSTLTYNFNAARTEPNLTAGYSLGISGVVPYSQMPFFAKLWPGAAEIYGSITNGTPYFYAAPGYLMNRSGITLDPTTPQIIGWQVDIYNYTGGVIYADIQWSVQNNNKTNVFSFLTGQDVINSTLTSNLTVNLLSTNACNSVSNGMSMLTVSFIPSGWSNNFNKTVGLFAMVGVSTNAAWNVTGTTTVWFVRLRQ